MSEAIDTQEEKIGEEQAAIIGKLEAILERV